MIDVIKKGEALFAAGNLEQAKNCFTDILTKDENSLGALNNLGVIAFQKNDIPVAIEYFKRALLIDPAYADARENLIEIESVYNELPETTEYDKYPKLENCKLALVNVWENKFNQYYTDYFSQKNDVRLLIPDSPEKLKPIIDWADLIWSPWANEPIVALTQSDIKSKLITHVRSYEILKTDLMNNIVWPQIDGAIFVADHIRDIANEIFPGKLDSIPQTTIHNFVDLSKYSFENHKSGRNLCFVGYLNEKKGIGLLMQSIHALARHDGSFKLHILGETQSKRSEIYMQHLIKEMKLEENVIFHGWVDNVPEMLSQMYYVISTSPWEGCPNNIIEAMACGVRPLIHNWRGARDLFPNDLIFDTIDQMVDQVLSDDYNSARYRQIVETNFNSISQLLKLDSFISAVYNKTEIPEFAPVNYNERRKGHSKIILKNHQADAEQAREKSDRTQNKNHSGINYCQPLPKSVDVIADRKKYVVDQCRGKRVLHIGCVDNGIMEQRINENNFLHDQINRVANNLIGLDLNEPGIDLLKEKGYEAYCADIEQDGPLLKELSEQVDIIVVPEVVEHLNNVGQFLSNLGCCNFKGEILISVPNSFSYRIITAMSQGIELVHPDHNYYFSYSTLKALLEKHNFEIEKFVMYYWPSDDEFGFKYRQLLSQNPYMAEGIIALINYNGKKE